MSTATRALTPGIVDLVSGLLLVGAIALLLWRVDDAVAPRTPKIAASTVTTAVAAAALDTSASEMVARNIFSATRRAPRVQFVPPRDEGPGSAATGMAGAVMSDAMGGMVGAPLPAMSGIGTANPDTAPRLYGIVSQDGVRRALLLLSDSGASPQLYGEGDRHRGYRVLAIASDHVVLATSTGSRTLRLARAPRDSLENLP